ncbi:hypothetical protein TIFTF001_054763, partial [Ficus carica]
VILFIEVVIFYDLTDWNIACLKFYWSKLIKKFLRELISVGALVRFGHRDCLVLAAIAKNRR